MSRSTGEGDTSADDKQRFFSLLDLSVYFEPAPTEAKPAESFK